MLTVGITTYRAYGDLDACVQSVAQSKWLPDRLVIVDSSENPKELPYTEETIGCPVDIWQPGRNIGCAASWNHVLTNYDGFVILANSDVKFHEDCIERLTRAARAQPEEMFFYAGKGNCVMAWSLFLQTPELFKRVGPYDSWFWPVCYEDADYWIRMKHHGIGRVRVDDAEYYHRPHGSVRDLDKDEKHVRKSVWDEANKAYYIKKWGGIPGKETFCRAFNNVEGKA